MTNRSAGDRRTITLDGEWEIIFDDDNRGKKEAWYQQKNFQAVEQKQKIHVPSCWEESKPDYEGIGWYSRTFKIGEIDKDHVVLIKFDAVNYYAEVWLNGMPLGFHEGGYTPFEFEATNIINHNSQNSRGLFGMVQKVSGIILVLLLANIFRRNY